MATVSYEERGAQEARREAEAGPAPSRPPPRPPSPQLSVAGGAIDSFGILHRGLLGSSWLYDPAQHPARSCPSRRGLRRAGPGQRRRRWRSSRGRWRTATGRRWATSASRQSFSATPPRSTPSTLSSAPSSPRPGCGAREHRSGPAQSSSVRQAARHQRRHRPPRPGSPARRPPRRSTARCGFFSATTQPPYSLLKIRRVDSDAPAVDAGRGLRQRHRPGPSAGRARGPGGPRRPAAHARRLGSGRR
jgi:hypothetical protein